MRPERTAARGDDQPPYVLPLLTPQALPDRAVLGIDRPDALSFWKSALPAPAPCRVHDSRARHHKHLFRRQRDLLARAKRGEGRRQGASSGDRDHDEVAPRVRDHRLDLCVKSLFARLAAYEVLGFAVARALPFCETEQLEATWVAIDHVKGLPADGSGRAEERDVHGARHLEKMEHRHIEVDEDRREKDRVDAVEDAAVAGDEVR